MKDLTFGSTVIRLQFNEPVEETAFTSETFDITVKSAYATIGISELIDPDNKIRVQFVIGQIFQEYFERAKIQKLDYLQKLSVNGVEVWCIDNGEVITLLKPQEY